MIGKQRALTPLGFRPVEDRALHRFVGEDSCGLLEASSLALSAILIVMVNH